MSSTRSTRRIPSAAIAAAVAATLGASGAGCSSCGGDSVAKLVAAKGSVDKGSAPSADAELRFAPAPVGERFAIGEAIRTGTAASARIELANAAGLDLAANTLLRFMSRAPGSASDRLRIESGEAQIEGGDDGLHFETETGVAQIEGGARVRVSNEGGKTRFDVLTGQAVLEQEAGGEPEVIKTGEALEIDHTSGAITRDVAIPPPPDAGVAEERELPDAERAAEEADAAEDTSVDAEAEPDAAAAPGGDAAAPAQLPDAGPPEETVSAVARGSGIEVMGAREKQWKTLEAGAQDLPAGARVRVPKGATLDLVREDGRATVTGSAEIVVGGAGGAILDARRGKAHVESTEQDAMIQVPGGVIVAKSGGSRALIEVAPDQTSTVLVRKGVAEIRNKKGGAAKSVAEGAVASIQGKGRVEVPPAPPETAAVTITAGESPTIHDPRPPTAVRVTFVKSCPAEGLVEVFRKEDGGRGRPFASGQGGGAAMVWMPAGSHRYRVRCLDPSGASVSETSAAFGSVRVSKDSGARPLPRTAPKNTLEADGRRYTVIYQNRLPELTFRWPDGPPGVIELHVEPEGAKLIEVPVRGEHTFPSGELAEGTYRWWFEGDREGTKVTSKVTLLNIQFDNAAPTAYLRDPPDGAVPEGPTIKVTGAALQGAKVSVGGKDVEVDGQHRFSAEIPVPTDLDAIGIRIAHPTRGVHYYLRHVGSRGR